MKTYTTFEEAYLEQLRDIFESPEYHNAPRGHRSREKIGMGFRLLDPVQRHVSLPARRTNLVFNFAEALWYLSGSNELALIRHYAPRMSQYSSDGRILTGTAYGSRIFDYPSGAQDQWQTVRNILLADPDSKRAIIQIFDPRELLQADNLDVACTLALQFLIRDGRLCCTAFMRANDAFRGVVSDVFSFTLLLEVMARELGVPVGTYNHYVGSAHVYESDAQRAEAVITQAIATERSPAAFPEMPPDNNWPFIKEVLTLEFQLRRNSLRLTPDGLMSLGLPDYWRHVVALLEAHRRITCAEPVDEVLCLLPKVFQSSLTARWPEALGRRS